MYLCICVSAAAFGRTRSPPHPAGWAACRQLVAIVSSCGGPTAFEMHFPDRRSTSRAQTFRVLSPESWVLSPCCVDQCPKSRDGNLHHCIVRIWSNVGQGTRYCCRAHCSSRTVGRNHFKLLWIQVCALNDDATKWLISNVMWFNN